MDAMTQQTQDALQAAGLTEAEITGFVEALDTFRDGLTPQQRDGFTAILAAAESAWNQDVQGYVVVAAAGGAAFATGVILGYSATNYLMHRGSVELGVLRGLRAAGY